MRAFTLDGFESTPGLRNDLPVPPAGAAELLVRVHASSVNPADASIASGMLKGMFEYDFPPGSDIVGGVPNDPESAERMEFELFNRIAA